MKKLRLIFVFIFLSGMLFTVFQYIPILEEETPGHRLEMTKKAKQNDTMDGDGDDADEDCGDDDDSEQEAGDYYSDHYKIYFTNKNLHFLKGIHSYKYLLENKNTPPPKV